MVPEFFAVSPEPAVAGGELVDGVDDVLARPALVFASGIDVPVVAGIAVVADAPVSADGPVLATRNPTLALARTRFVVVS